MYEELKKKHKQVLRRPFVEQKYNDATHTNISLQFAIDLLEEDLKEIEVEMSDAKEALSKNVFDVILIFLNIRFRKTKLKINKLKEN